MKKVLVIGGTGIIGKPVVFQLIKHNEYAVYTVSLERADNPPLPSSVHQYIVDRRSDDFENVVNEILSDSEYGFDAVIDLIAYDEKDSRKTYGLLKDYTKQFIILSTTLVYDRSEQVEEPISEDTPIAEEGMYGGYVDGKIRLEKFWNSVVDNEWTIFRPYHILGKYSLLGCVPEHNRDPKIIDTIKNEEEFRLVNGGNINFNYIHPTDIATVIYKTIGNKNTYKQTYNLINPEIITSSDYYHEIGKQLGKIVKIKNISLKDYLQKDRGWEMTILPHVYSAKKLEKDMGFVPSIKISEAIKDSIHNQPQYNLPISEIPVHKNMNKPGKPILPKWLF